MRILDLHGLIILLLIVVIVNHQLIIVLITVESICGASIVIHLAVTFLILAEYPGHHDLEPRILAAVAPFVIARGQQELLTHSSSDVAPGRLLKLVEPAGSSLSEGAYLLEELVLAVNRFNLQVDHRTTRIHRPSRCWNDVLLAPFGEGLSRLIRVGVR